MKNQFTIFILFLSALFLSPYQVDASPDPTDKKATSKSAQKLKVKPRQFSGAKYIVATQEKKPLFFTKKYSKSGKFIFVTSYDIYDFQKKVLCRVTAKHNKKSKNIEVVVKDLQSEGFPISNMAHASYETPAMNRFGAIGKVGAIGKGKSRTQAPNQLTLGFLNKKYEYIKVIHIADAHEDGGKDLQVFILEE